MAKKTIFFIVFTFFILNTFLVSKTYAVFDCLTLTTTSNQSDKDFCRNELNDIEAQLADLLSKQKEQQKQTGTLKGDVSYLTSQINALKVKIKARTLVIAQLKVNIEEKLHTINSLVSKIDREHESLSKLLRNTNEFDKENMIHLVISDESVSSFYNDLEAYTSIDKAIKSSTDLIKGIKTQTETAKKDLEQKQNAQIDAKVELENAQKKVVQTETEKKQLLAISKDKEASYAKHAAEKKVRADKIRAALFQLRDTKAIPFGLALQYAKQAEIKTNVAPAFLLAIITQESNLGTDSGSCYVTNLTNGDGVSSKSGKFFSKVMHPTRDIPPFVSILNSLGLEPLKTLVSCPIGGYGYGGAMGPAQFIPSTWAGIKNKLALALGITNPDPWEPRDALMASAIFLGDLGANSNSYSAQMKAACKYYGTGGSSCAYGRSVMGKVANIQNNIDFLNKN